MNNTLVGLIILVLTGSIFFISVQIMKRRIVESEKQNKPFYQDIEQYAFKERLLATELPLYSEQGRRQLYGLLPKNLPLTPANWPMIPLYTDEIANTKRRYLNAYVLTDSQAGSQQKIIVLPIYLRKDGSMVGVVMTTFPTAKTTHWLSIEAEEWWLRRSDAQLESHAFNDAYSVRASNRTLLTEVLDPEFMTQLQSMPASVISVWLQAPLSYAAQKGVLTQAFISNLRAMSREFQLRFDRAYPSYPESNKAEP